VPQLLCKRLAQFLSRDKEYHHLGTAAALLKFLVPSLAGVAPRHWRQMMSKYEVDLNVQPVFGDLAKQVKQGGLAGWQAGRLFGAVR